MPNFKKKFLFLSVQNFLRMLLSLTVPKGNNLSVWWMEGAQWGIVVVDFGVFILHTLSKVLKY